MKKVKTICIVISLAMLASALSFVSPAQAELNIGGSLEVYLSGNKAKNTDNSSDIAIDELDLSLETELNEHVTANVLLKAENGNNDGEGNLNAFVDEAYITLNKVADQPVNVTLGKWVLPFGVFNNHLINDPLTQDAYEINASALSIAFVQEGPIGLDLSATLYGNSNQLFDPPAAGAENDLGNYILNATVKPVEFVDVSIYFDSEQWANNNDRNDTIGASVSATLPMGLSVDAEYITAVYRLGSDVKEYAYSASVAYEILPVLEVAARYEGYEDDNGVDDMYDPDNTGLLGLEYRVSLGGSYEIYENTSLMAEYRISEVEDSDQSNIHDWTVGVLVEF